MDLIVTPDPKIPTRGTLICGTEAFPCALGRSGVTTKKHEGDGATPIGTFPLRRVFYRAERMEEPATKLPIVPTDPNDGWCDDAGHAQYNHLVRMRFAGRAEYLWRDDHVYDVIVVIGYNDAPVKPGHGSAIFMHIAQPDFSPTEGCVALRQDDLLAVLQRLDVDSTITIKPAHR